MPFDLKQVLASFACFARVQRKQMYRESISFSLRPRRLRWLEKSTRVVCEIVYTYIQTDKEYNIVQVCYQCVHFSPSPSPAGNYCLRA